MWKWQTVKKFFFLSSLRYRLPYKREGMRLSRPTKRSSFSPMPEWEKKLSRSLWVVEACEEMENVIQLKIWVAVFQWKYHCHGEVTERSQVLQERVPQCFSLHHLTSVTTQERSNQIKSDQQRTAISTIHNDNVSIGSSHNVIRYHKIDSHLPNFQYYGTT